MSLQLQSAQYGLSLGGVIGGIGRGIIDVVTGNPGAAIGDVVRGFTSGGSKTAPPVTTAGSTCAPWDLACMGRNVQGWFQGGAQSPNGTACAPSGYHLNKHALPPSKKHGAVAARTILVRNRHMNPLNGSAARRAIRRLKGAKKAFRDIERFVGSRTSRARSSGGCGCKTKRR